MALGASAGSVRGLIVRQGMTPAVIGLVAGLLGAYFLTEVMQKILFGVEPTDPATFAGVAAFLAAIALLASYLPARRATRVAPTEALRYDSPRFEAATNGLTRTLQRRPVGRGPFRLTSLARR